MRNIVRTVDWNDANLHWVLIWWFYISGSFWHITDLHWDPTYRLANENSGSVCNSSGNRPTPQAGTFGHYLCDSPWDLISSSVNAMKDILPDPDFIIWTGYSLLFLKSFFLGCKRCTYLKQTACDFNLY